MGLPVPRFLSTSSECTNWRVTHRTGQVGLSCTSQFYTINAESSSERLWMILPAWWFAKASLCAMDVSPSTLGEIRCWNFYTCKRRESRGKGLDQGQQPGTLRVPKRMLHLWLCSRPQAQIWSMTFSMCSSSAANMGRIMRDACRHLKYYSSDEECMLVA